MKVLIAGGTGTLGMPIVRDLLEGGHSIAGITRTPEGAERLRGVGATAIVADAMDRDGLLGAVDGQEAEVVVHQLTALKKAPVGHKGLARTNELRTQGTTNLLDVARAVGARRFVTQSIVLGYGYRDHGDAVLTEESPFGLRNGSPFDAHADAMVSAEQQAFAAEGIDGIALRYGLLYGNDIDTVVRMLRRRSLPVAAKGGLIPFVHHEDAATATVAAIERGGDGEAYNVVDDTPAPFRELVTTIAETQHAPKPLVLPTWLLELVAPYGGVVLGEVSMRVSNAKAKRELGWAPRYPSIREGVAAASPAS